MDKDTAVSEMQHRDSNTGFVHPLKLLKLIEVAKWKPERLEWLWRKVASLDYTFDDIYKGHPEIFIAGLYSPANVHFELGDDGYLAATDIIYKVGCNIHAAFWGDIPITLKHAAAKEMFGFLFDNFELNRITAFVPSFNKEMIRAVTLMGFRYEGEFRKMFFKRGMFHNVLIYGMLREEFFKKEVAN